MTTSRAILWYTNVCTMFKLEGVIVFIGLKNTYIVGVKANLPLIPNINLIKIILAVFIAGAGAFAKGPFTFRSSQQL